MLRAWRKKEMVMKWGQTATAAAWPRERRVAKREME
jgi:hypothetical protein